MPYLPSISRPFIHKNGTDATCYPPTLMPASTTLVSVQGSLGVVCGISGRHHTGACMDFVSKVNSIIARMAFTVKRGHYAWQG